MKRMLASLVVVVTLFAGLAARAPVRAQVLSIRLDGQGWSEPSVGTWDPVTRTATLRFDLVNWYIEIVGDGITLDGNGHALGAVEAANIAVWVQGNDVTVRNVTARGNYTWGILLQGSGGTLTDNRLIDVKGGIACEGVNDALISGNTVQTVPNAAYGMYIHNCTGLTLRDNVMSNGILNFGVDGTSPEFYDHDIDTSNLTDGKRIYYIRNASGQVLDGVADAGAVYLVNCSGMTVANLTLTGNMDGVCLVNTHDSRVENTETQMTGYGVRLISSDRNVIEGNRAADILAGVRLDGATGNVLSANEISGGGTGLGIYGGGGNTVQGCTVTGATQYGLQLQDTADNQVYGNHLLSNAVQASVEGGSGNVFNLPAPIGGNYWSDWTGPDTNNDGFVDGPYVFAGGQDNLPLCVPVPADTIAPRTDLAQSGEGSLYGWWHTDVQIELMAVDWAGSGVASTEYHFDGTTWTVYDGPFDVTDEGTTTVYYRSTDNVGNVEETKSVAIRIDKTPPVVVGTPTTEPNAAGWYNHEVIIDWTASDALSGLDPSWGPVRMVMGCAAPGPIVVQPGIVARDLAGNEASGTMPQIRIDCAPPAIAITTPAPGAVLPVGTALEFAAADDRSGLATLTATLDDGTGPVPVVSGDTPGAGVYTLTVVASDVAGNTASEARDFVVCDPAAGSVTGSGWFDSPVGAYPADEALTGKASFHFDAGYEAGASVPSGRTQLQLKAAGLDLASTSYEWLAVGGSSAEYKGVGTINGAGEYGFLLSAVDGQPDLLRIKIWDEASGVVIYDNQPGADEHADPTTAIGGGSIAVKG